MVALVTELLIIRALAQFRFQILNNSKGSARSKLHKRNTTLGCITLSRPSTGVPTMQDVQTMLRQLRRPRLLAQAARFGAEDYRREAHLRRLLGRPNLPGPAEAALILMEREAEMNAARVAGLASYSFADHVYLLIALVGEARLLRAATLRPVPDAAAGQA